MGKLRGLFLDSAEIDTPPGMYRFAKNIVGTNNLGAIENEDGFKELGEYAPYTVIGFIPMVKSIAVFSTDNVDSEVGVIEISDDYSTYTYTTVYNDPELNFSTDAPIKGRLRTDVNNNRIVVWIDVNNPPRIINIDDQTGIDDVNDLALFQGLNNPALEDKAISNSGGSLTVGALIPITQYKNRDGSTTNWFVHTEVFYITDDPTSNSFPQMDGAEGGTPTSKSISFTLTGCDTNYEKINLGYIKSTNGILTAYKLGDVVVNSSVNVVITGAETTTEDLSIDEILTPGATYDTATAISDLNGRLFLGNLTAQSYPELQEAALGAVVNYTTEATDVFSNVDGNKSSSPTLLPGEVYALYLGVELLNGGWVAYHMPGREIADDIINEDFELTNEGLTYKRFQVTDTSNNSSATCNLAYWQNENELYPESEPFITAGLNGQRVRHHRMPQLDTLIAGDFGGVSTMGVTQLPRLSLEVSNVIIPVGIQPYIKRWKIFYAKKTATNSLFLGSDLLQFGMSPDADHTKKWSTGGNWKITATSTGWSDFDDPSGVAFDTLRGHCLDMRINSSLASPTYAWFPYKLTRSSLNSGYSGFRSGTGSIISLTGAATGGSNQDAFFCIDYTDIASRSGSGFFKSLQNFKYLPPNAIDGKFSTEYTEGVFVADINNYGDGSFAGLLSTILTTCDGDDAIDTTPFTGNEEVTMPMLYFKYLTDVHSSFFNETLIPLEGYAAPNETTLSATGGDGFACHLSFLTAAPKSSDPLAVSDTPLLHGVRVWRGYIGYSRYNLNFRHQTNGEIATYYHGKTDMRDMVTPSARTGTTTTYRQILFDLTGDIDKIEYNSDFNQLNEFTNPVVWSPDLIQETEFPNTIIFTPVQAEESKEFSWRLFPSGNRYVMPKNKGEITNLQAFNNNELLIQHEFATYRTRTDARQAVDGENIFLKSAEIFDLPPEELIPTSTGYAGNQNRFGSVMTPFGFAWIDDLQGKVFLYTGNKIPEEISANNCFNFFRDFMQLQRSEAVFDNPFIDNGYTLGYDGRFKRIILGKKNDDLSWTISYSPTEKVWKCFHDYTPDYSFQGIDGYLYTLKDNILYLTNYKPTDTEKGVFFDAEPFSSFVDVIHNEEAYRDKEFVGVQWITEVYPNGETNGQLNTTLDYTTTCTHLTLRTPQHCTGRVPLVLFEDLDSLYEQNIRNLNRTWYFDDIRDIVTDPGFVFGFYDNFDIDDTKLNINMAWYEQRKFLDKYVICRYEFDNQENKRWLFLEDAITFKYAVR